MVFFGNGYYCLCCFFTVIVHEMAHSAVARRLGYTLSGIRLMPYGASLNGSFEALKPTDEIKIALAGPALNFLLAILFVAVWWLAPSSYFFTESLVSANLSLGMFNLLPIFPLDGGRILLAALSQKYPRRRIYRRLRLGGLVAGGVFAALFVLSIFFVPNVTFFAAGAFIVLSTVFPDRVNTYERVYSMAYMSERIKRGLPVKEIMIDAGSTLMQLSRLLNANYYVSFILVDQSLNKRGVLTETQLERAIMKYGAKEKAERVLLCDKR